ncbi:MAG TPA: PBSX family phage terminase large subunit [Thermodesulfovibrio thiophilus]|nr:PBSX family phage terminase large subunit [Thermodesulfovibrio thiophilus]HQD37136.1 PBSX family phage terminase large subunit [Thermodesulfovibrio thiophilus]
MKINLKATPIFYKNLQSIAKVVLNRGGARSSKSFSITQVFLYKFLTEQNKRMLVVRKSLPSLRLSTHSDFKHVLEEAGVSSKVKEEKQFLNYYYKDNFLHFGSLDDAEKIKSTNFSYIFMDEATEFTYNDFLMLKLRLSTPSVDGKKNQMFLAFNPIDEFHWIKDKLMITESDYEEIHSTYKDNPFLDKDYIEMLEGLANQDPNYYRIYVLGEWGRFENLVYRNWTEIEFIPKDDILDTFYGLDFGYNDPTSLVKVNTSKSDVSKIYVTQLIYQTKLTTPELIELMKEKGIAKRHIIYADAADPDKIKEIASAGFHVKPANKSVFAGIETVKRYNLFVDKYSLDLIKELKTYSWQTDKNGKPTDKPIDYFNHAVDALRYALHSFSKTSGRVRLRWI